MALPDKQKGTYNIDLQHAVQHLRDKKIISKDKEIAVKMGVGQGTVSNYVNGKSEASPNFRKNFEKAFGLELADFAKPAHTDIPDAKKPSHEDQADELAQAKAEAKEANAVIRGYNLWMQRMMELNFSDLLSKQEGEIGIVIEILKLGARLEAGGNPDKAREILADSLHRIGPDLSPKMKEDIERDVRN